MIDTHNIKLISDFIQKELRMSLVETCFFKLDDGSYEIFNKFLITKEGERYKVETSTATKYFNFLKTAVTWCILQKRNLLGEMLIIEELDMRLVGVELSTKQHIRLYKSSKAIEDKLLFLDKINEDTLKKQSITKEIDRLVKDTREWQLKKFNKPKV